MRHRHTKDSQIYFKDVGHKYYVDWHGDGKFTCDESMSVTAVCKSFFNKFDADAVIQRMMERDNWPKNKYYGMTVQEIKDQWAALGVDACAKGSKMHDWIDRYYNGIEELSSITDNQIELTMFKKLCAEIHDPDERMRLEPYRSEWFLQMAGGRITGAVDMLYVNINKMKTERESVLHLVMYDWKRCKNLNTAGWGCGKGIGPCERFKDTNYYHYTLQLNMYKYILETTYGGAKFNGKVYDKIVVDSMFLVVMHPNNKGGSFIRAKVCVATKIIEEIVELRRKCVKSENDGNGKIWPFKKDGDQQ